MGTRRRDRCATARSLLTEQSTRARGSTVQPWRLRLQRGQCQCPRCSILRSQSRWMTRRCCDDARTCTSTAQAGLSVFYLPLSFDKYQTFAIRSKLQKSGTTARWECALAPNHHRVIVSWSTCARRWRSSVVHTLADPRAIDMLRTHSYASTTSAYSLEY